jgi:hypothetical protein
LAGLGAAALGATMWSVGSLSMLWSVYARTPRAATQRAGQVADGASATAAEAARRVASARCG